VISVGNLHWGGGGKTPLVAAIASHLAAAGRRPVVLSRGWGRRDPGSVRVLRNGDDVATSGDEPALLARLLPGVPIVVGADRHAAGLHALEHGTPRPNVAVLDDGFSHLRLRRDVDLLVFPAADPLAGGRLWPGGRLREPLSSVARADAALLTGVDEDTATSQPSASELASALGPHGFRGASFVSRTRTDPARTLDGRPLAPGAPVLLVAAVARPSSFLETARRQGFSIAGTLFFPDHHPYPDSSLERIAARALSLGVSTVLVTSKDAVKLLGRQPALPHLVLGELPVRADPEAAFWTWLEGALP
jgi:tetraacyldisaccharide 4'-kinase